jgi:hypothetical protein
MEAELSFEEVSEWGAYSTPLYSGKEILVLGIDDGPEKGPEQGPEQGPKI